MTWLAGLALASMGVACAPITGNASFPILSDNRLDQHLVPTGKKISDSDCTHNALILILWGNANPNHENLVQRVLEENQADGLINAKLKTGGYGFPLLYFQNCVYVEGELAKLEGTQ
jgi:hypothetical protein